MQFGYLIMVSTIANRLHFADTEGVQIHWCIKEDAPYPFGGYDDLLKPAWMPVEDPDLSGD